MSFRARKAAGNYDWSDDDLTEARFPVTASQHGDWQCDLIAPVDGRFIVPKGWQASEIGHSLAFGATYPELQRKWYIVSTGSVAKVYGSRFCPMLCQNGSERRLGLYWLDLDFDSDDRLLVVRPLVA